VPTLLPSRVITTGRPRNSDQFLIAIITTP
jgi:hypothetical protein